MNIYRNYLLRRAWIILTFVVCGSVSAAAHATDKANEQAPSATRTDSGNWDVTLGAGVLVKPEYDGADKTETLVLPYFELAWKDRVYLSVGDGLGTRLYAGDRLSIDGGIGFDFGRDDDDADLLRGLGDIDFAPTVRVGADYRLGPVATFINVNKHVGGTNGLQLELGATVAMPLALLAGGREAAALTGANAFKPGPVLVIKLSADYADDKYMSGYFGVDAAQSARTGLGQFSPGAGFNSVGGDALVVYPIAGRWAINALGSYTRIVGDAADSPIVLARDQFAFGLFATYRY